MTVIIKSAAIKSFDKRECCKINTLRVVKAARFHFLCAKRRKSGDFPGFLVYMLNLRFLHVMILSQSESLVACF